MELFVYSRPAIERVPAHDVPHVVISITSSPDDVARIPASPQQLGTLRLSFADVDHDADPALTSFDGTHADAIAAFVRAHRDRVQRIVVHCDAGLSRSPAAQRRSLAGSATTTRSGSAATVPTCASIAACSTPWRERHEPWQPYVRSVRMSR